MNRTKHIEEQAALWLAREDRGLELTETEELADWLNAATVHRVVYLRLRAAWHRIDRLAALKTPQQAYRSNGSSLRFPPRWSAIAAGLALFFLFAGAAYYLYPANKNYYATAIGEHRIQHLADGTLVELNTDTQLQTSEDRTSRTVRLTHGEAYFEAVHDSNRPLVVIAGNHRIRDVGTKFAVRYEGDRLTVAVTEGLVRMAADAHKSDRTIDAPAGTIILDQAGETLVTHRSPQSIADMLSWRQGFIVFDQKTLAGVVEEFNRYNRKHIIVIGPARDLRIGGYFRTDNVAVFAQLIRKGFDLKVEDNGSEIIISE
jgi:transmembrane sensor